MDNKEKDTRKKLNIFISTFIYMIITAILCVVMFVYIGNEVGNKPAQQLMQWLGTKSGVLINGTLISSLFVLFKMAATMQDKALKSNNNIKDAKNEIVDIKGQINSVAETILGTAKKIDNNPDTILKLIERQDMLNESLDMIMQFLKLGALENPNISEDIRTILLKLERSKAFELVGESIKKQEEKQEEKQKEEQEEKQEEIHKEKQEDAIIVNKKK